MLRLYSTFSFVVLMITAAQVSGQVNSYFENNPVWRVGSACSWSYPCVEEEDYNYYVSDTTTIDGLDYMTISKYGVGQNMWYDNPPDNGCNGTYEIEQNSIFHLRSEDKKMYIHFGGNSEEELLYDFDLDVGDTLPISYNHEFDLITVSAVDSILIGGQLYRRMFLSGAAAEYIIEGIGSDIGLVEPVDLILSCGSSLICYSQNGNSLFPFPGVDCQLTVSVPHEEAEPTISIFPHPMNTVSTLELGAIQGPVTVVIHDLTGKVVHQSHHTNHPITLARNGLQAGLYVLSVEQKGTSVASTKLILGQ